MVYYNNIPQATDKPSQSQSQIASNFSDLDTIFAINHVTYTDATATNRGKHEYVSMIEQGLDPAPAANEMALYTKDLDGVATLYVQKESAGTVIQLTGPQNPIVATNPGQTFLPGGLIMKWGIDNIGTANTTVTFGTQFPTGCLHVQLTAQDPNAHYATVVSVAAENFVGKADSSVNFFYLAIGY